MIQEELIRNKEFVQKYRRFKVLVWRQKTSPETNRQLKGEVEKETAGLKYSDANELVAKLTKGFEKDGCLHTPGEDGYQRKVQLGRDYNQEKIDRRKRQLATGANDNGLVKEQQTQIAELQDTVQRLVESGDSGLVQNLQEQIEELKEQIQVSLSTSGAEKSKPKTSGKSKSQIAAEAK